MLSFALALCACGDTEQSPVWLDDGPRPGCVDGKREEQRHGTACLCCHSDEFGVAGSVDTLGAPVARVVVSDGAGRTADMIPNGFGNFFRHLRLSPPLTAVIYGPDGSTLTMGEAAPSGDCNSCHARGLNAAPLRGPE